VADLLQRIRSVTGTPARSEFNLSDLDRFPFADYAHNLSSYEEYERWYTGAALAEYIQVGLDKVLRWSRFFDKNRSSFKVEFSLLNSLTIFFAIRTLKNSVVS